MRYEPCGRVLERFRASDAFVRGIRGPIGSGKSTACVVEIIRRATLQAKAPDGLRYSRWAVIRNTYPELKTTTIKTWHQWLPPHVGRWQAEGPPTHFLEHGDLRMEVMFLAMDRPEDVRKALSLEVTGAWINEAREVPRAIVDALTGRLGRYPGPALGGASWKGLMMDTNAPDTDHWWYKFAEEETPEDWAFFAQPSGMADDAENLENLEQTPETLAWPIARRREHGRTYYRRVMAGKDQDWINVYVHGQYGYVRDGKPVIPEYRDQVHCQPCRPVPKVPLMVGIDFGLTPAAIVMQATPGGQIRWLDELATEDMGARRFGELLRAKLQADYPEWAGPRGYGVQFVGDPAGEQRAQSDETTPYQILAALGIPARPAHTNDFAIRREAIAAPLSRIVDGVPGLVMDPRCRVARKGLMGGYCYKRVAVMGAERYHDKPDKTAYSHAVEAGGYGMLGLGEGRAVLRRPGWERPRTGLVADGVESLYS